MDCPKCAEKTRVNHTDSSGVVERCRRCLRCGYSFLTVEAIKDCSYWKEYKNHLIKTERFFLKNNERKKQNK